LQTSIEELEASNEELQSMVEEFQSTTEELQSGNEELQTTNEELQSTNEELQTVNDELKTKSEELAQANDDLQNILNIALSGIIVLDDQLRITRYSAASKEIFKLWPTSIGKPLIGMESLLDLSILSQQIEETVKSGKTSEQQLDLGDKTYGVKLIPLFDNDRPKGLIVTFDDMTSRRRDQANTRRLAAVVRDSNDAVTVHDFDGNIQAWNRAATETYGFSEAQAETHNIFDFVPDDASDDYQAMIKRLKTGEELAPLIATRMARGGERLRVQLTLTLLRDDLNHPIGIATTERLMPEGG
jgi:two-component system CheB/CheR fusion protein